MAKMKGFWIISSLLTQFPWFRFSVVDVDDIVLTYKE